MLDADEPESQSRWRRRVRRIVVVILFLYLAGCGGMYSFQDSMLFPGRRTQGTADAAAKSGPTTETITLAAADGTRVVVRYRPATPAAPHAPTILFFYGNAMCAAWCDDIVQMLHDLGCNVLVPDYLGYGQSGGRASEANCYATADAVWQYVNHRPDVDSNRIIVMGWSLGSAVAIDLTSRSQPAGLITLSAFTGVRDVASQMFPLFPVRWLLRSKFANLDKASSIHCPTLIVHGRKDTIIDPRMADQLHAAIAGSELLWLDNADHNSMFEADPQLLEAAIGRLLNRATRTPATQPARG